MNKAYYLVHDKNHYGPYHLSDIQSLIEKKQIKSEMQLWRSGWKNAQRLSDKSVIEELGIASLPPPIPETIQNIHPQLPNKTAIYQTLSDKAGNPDLAQQTKTLLYQSKTSGFKRIHDLASLTSQRKIPFYQIQFKYDKNLFLNGLISILMLGMVIKATFDLLPNKQNENKGELKSFSRPSAMSLREYHKINSWINSNNTNEIFKVLTSKDSKILWLLQKDSFNNLTIELEGKSGKIFSPKGLKLKWQTNTAMDMTTLKTADGMVLPQGKYQVKISYSKDRSWWELPKTKAYKTWSGQLLLGHQTEQELNLALKKFFNPKKINNSNNHFSEEQELIEKYQTLISITRDISDFWNILLTLKSKDRPEAINEFKEHYGKSGGSFFTSMFLENEKKAKKWTRGSNKLRTKLLAHLSYQNDLAKEIGLLTVDLLTDFQKMIKGQEDFDKKIDFLQNKIVKKMNLISKI